MYPLLAFLFFLSALALIRAFYEPGSLDVTHRTLTAARRAGSPASVRVAVFSDLHADSLRIKPEQLVEALRRDPADLMVFLGDLASGDSQSGMAARFLGVMSAAAKEAGIPFLAVAGNHDGQKARQVLRSLDIDLLENEGRRITTASGSELDIIGYTDLKADWPDPELLTAAPDHHEKAQIRIVLAHNPDTILHLPEDSGDFFLSGHFHGGQIYAPLQLEFRLLRPEMLPRRGIWRGSFSLNGYSGYITRGLGCVWLPLRLFSKPELAILELRR